jgi:hypothetical protein
MFHSACTFHQLVKQIIFVKILGRFQKISYFHQKMKERKNMKEITSNLDFEQLLRGLFARIPFLSLESYEREVQIDTGVTSRADAVAQVSVGGQSWTVVVEEKRLGQPREVRHAVLQLERLLRQIDGKSYGLLLAPFTSEESARICAEAGIGYADLSGNARLSFGQVFIELQSADRPYRELRQRRSLFTPKAERILRVILTPPLRGWKVEELAAAAGVSLGQVSNVRKQLLDQEWAITSEQGLWLNRPEMLAREWQKAYGKRSQKQEKLYTLLQGEEFERAMRTALADAGEGEHAVLASYSAACWLAPYARQATQFFYVDEMGGGILKKYLQLQPVPRGENVILIHPKEDDVFAGRIEAAPNIWCTGLVQTWLDLSVAGERGDEAAEHLLQEKLLPAWQAEGL